MEANGQGEVRLELFLRSFSPRGAAARTDDILDRLDRLDGRGRIDEASVHLWGSRVRPDTARRTATGRFILDRIDDFRGWARRPGRSLEPSFEVRTVASDVTGDELTVVSLPVVALAEYRGSDLLHVSPSRDGTRRWSVEDRLARLEAEGAVGANPAGDSPPDPRVRSIGEQ